MNWSLLMAGGLAIVVLLLWGPGAKQMLKQSAAVENPDWAGALIPLALVVLFVILLIMLS